MSHLLRPLPAPGGSCRELMACAEPCKSGGKQSLCQGAPSGPGEDVGPGPRHVLCLGWWWGAARDAPAFGPPHLRCTNWVSSLSFPASFPIPALPKLVFWPRITPATVKGAAQISPRRDRVKISIFWESPVKLGSQGSGGGGPMGTPSPPPPFSPAITSQPGLHQQPPPHW